MLIHANSHGQDGVIKAIPTKLVTARPSAIMAIPSLPKRWAILLEKFAHTAAPTHPTLTIAPRAAMGAPVDAAI